MDIKFTEDEKRFILFELIDSYESEDEETEEIKESVSEKLSQLLSD